MSKHWYAETLRWASVSKAKKAKRKARRAAHTYAPRGRSSLLRQDVREAMIKVGTEMQRPLDMPEMPGVPRTTSRDRKASSKRGVL